MVLRLAMVLLQFCRPNWIMNGLTDLEDLTPVLARWRFLAEV